jgi:DNA-binding response OmpR family regulator/DNA-binding CsgD family transcriptional regulator
MNKLLVVDDDIAHIKSMVYFLVKNLECDVLSATTGSDAIGIIKETLPDLILIDWNMPEMSGIETIIELKNNDAFCDIPVIMMSGLMMTPSNLMTAMQVGAVDFLRKPIDEVELISRVRNMLRISEMQNQMKRQNLLLQNQLTSNMSSLQHLTEQKKAIKKKLKDLKQSLSRNNQQISDDLFGELEEIVNEKEFDWDDFQTNFEFIHSDFFKRLKQLYPTLTATELRMCAFIRLNMTNKEISSIISISPESVNTARKRLKRKMEVESGVNLAEKLINL